MLPERIGEAAKEGDLETIRAYFEDDSNGERDVDDVCESENSIMWRTLIDGTDHSSVMCASRTARCWCFEGSRCGATSCLVVAREAPPGGRRPSPSSHATATMESSGMSSRSGARPNKNRNLPTSNRRQRQRQQRRVHAGPRREEAVPVVAPPEGRYRLLQRYMKGAVNNFPPRLADGPQEPRPVEERDVSEARS